MLSISNSKKKRFLYLRFSGSWFDFTAEQLLRNSKSRLAIESIDNDLVFFHHSKWLYNIFVVEGAFSKIRSLLSRLEGASTVKEAGSLMSLISSKD